MAMYFLDIPVREATFLSFYATSSQEHSPELLDYHQPQGLYQPNRLKYLRGWQQDQHTQIHLNHEMTCP